MNPALRRQRILLPGELPSPINPPGGCACHTRCRIAQARCRADNPLRLPGGVQRVACPVVQDTVALAPGAAPTPAPA